MNIRLGRISQILTPSYSACLRCHTTWAFAKEHTTQYSPSEGCFPLCQKCWAELSPEQRLPFYEAHIARNERTLPGHYGGIRRGLIREAVLAGK